MPWLKWIYCLKSKIENKKMTKMLQKTGMKLERDASIERIIKHIRDVKLILKSQLLNEELRFKVQYNKNNVVCLADQSNEVEDPGDILSIYNK